MSKQENTLRAVYYPHLLRAQQDADCRGKTRKELKKALFLALNPKNGLCSAKIRARPRPKKLVGNRQRPEGCHQALKSLGKPSERYS